MTETGTKMKIDIITVYRIIGFFSVVWSLSVIAKQYVLSIYETFLSYGFLARLGWNIGVPILLCCVLRNKICPSKGLIVAFCALTGCCITVTSLNLLSKFHPLPSFICSVVILLLSVAGYTAGYLLYIHDRFHDLYSTRLIERILKDLIYGFIAGWILSSLFSSRFVSGLVFIISMLHVSIAHKILTAQVKKLKERAFAELEKERLKKMASLDEYDEKVRRYEEEKAAKEREEKTRREQAKREARERAEKAREEREKSEQERRYRHAGNRQHQKQSQAGDRSFIRRYFTGCNNKTELKRRYRQLCKKLHPDCPGGNAESFRRMQTEYEYLLKTMAA